MRKTAREFEASAEIPIKVNVGEIAREVLREKEATALMSKAGTYDLVCVPSEWIAELAEGGLLEPLDGYMDDPTLPEPDRAD